MHISPSAPTTRLSTVLVLGFSLILAAGCSKSDSPTPTSPTPSVTTPPVNPPRAPILSLEPDTPTPVGQAVAITYANRGQDPGGISVMVTAFNLNNAGAGFDGAQGALRWDDSFFEFEAQGGGDLLREGDNARVEFFTHPLGGTGPGIRNFVVRRRDRSLVSGSGDLYLVRLRLREGVTTGTTRVELVPIDSGVGNLLITLRLIPFSASHRIQNTYGATVTVQPSE